MNKLTDRFHTEELQASCRLVQHPMGAFKINGKPYRPEWGRAPHGEEAYGRFYDKVPEVLELAVREANKVCVGKNPRQIRIEMYEGDRVKILIQE